MLNITAARRARGKSIELNMAPLIDMVFILLIFFLVTTSFIKETGVDVQRPTAATAESKEKTSLLIAVTADDRVFIDQKEVDLRAVRLHVERALAENPEGGVIVVADKNSSTGVTITVMDGCRLAGADNVSLAASEPGR